VPRRQAEDELAAAKASVTQALQMIPEYCHVGLVTFGTHVHVHELGFAECSKCYVFRGSKEYTPQQARRRGSGAGTKGRPRGGGCRAAARRARGSARVASALGPVEGNSC
jgi:protein transport protein SEC23